MTPRSELDAKIIPPTQHGLEARLSLARGEFSLDLHLDAPGRGVTAIFGPSGSGKTTLLRAIAGLEIDPRGYLRIGDQIWQHEGLTTPTHERPIGYVFQEPSLFEHLTVRGNLEYPLQRIRQTDKKISFHDTIDLLGLEAFLDRRPQDLSGGERQRVAMARALLTSPKLLLLDEPLAALDEGAKREILPYLERLVDELEIPALYVSHSTDEVSRFADFLVLLERGTITASGPIEEMLTRLDLPLARGDDAKAILEAVVVGHDVQHHLTDLQFQGGLFTIPRRDLQPGEKVRLRILARDVSLTLERQSDTSILNIFPVEIEEVIDENEAQVVVRLSASGTPLLARITKRSAEALGLTARASVWAQVKSVALLR